jgi:hypothetical protein
LYSTAWLRSRGIEPPALPAELDETLSAPIRVGTTASSCPARIRRPRSLRT